MIEKRPKTCSSCETKYTVEWDIEVQDLEPLTCPFCGHEVEELEDEEDSGQTNPKTIIGIDYSLTSPAICITKILYLKIVNFIT
jgi:hypothetical protein